MPTTIVPFDPSSQPSDRFLVTQLPQETTNPFENNERLRLLMLFAKNLIHKDAPRDWSSIGLVLADEYHHNLMLKDALHHVLRAYLDAMKEPRFQMPYAHDPAHRIQDMLWSVVRPFDNGDTILTIKEVLSRQIEHMLSALMLTHVGWCHKELLGDLPDPWEVRESEQEERSAPA